MSEYEIKGTVSLDTGGAAQGAKEVRSELETMAKSGIAGFEAAKERVIDLRKSIGQLRDELLKTQDPAKVEVLNKALSAQSAQLRAATMNFKAMSLEAGLANEKAQLLAGSLGINLPAGIDRLLARMPGVQAALGVAFNASIVLAVGAAILAILPKLDEWLDKLRGIEAASADVYKEVAKTNAVLGAFGPPDSVKAMRDQIRDVGAEITRVQEHLKSLQTTALGPIVGPAKTWLLNRKEISLLEDQLKDLIARQKELGDAIPEQKVKDHAKALDEQAKAAAEAAKKVAELNAEISRSDLLAIAQERENAENALTKAIKERAAAEMEANKDLATGWHQYVLESNKAQDEIIKTMEGGQKRAWEIQKTTIDQAREMARAQQQAVTETASKIESFIDRVFLTAKSLSDVFHQFLMQILGSFVKWASRMIADAMAGMKQAQSGGGGGIFGSLLGGLFGIGSGAVSAAGAPGQVSSVGGIANLGLGSSFAGISQSTISSVISGGGGGTGIPAAAGGATKGFFGQLAFNKGAFLDSIAPLAAGLGLTGGIGLLAHAGGPLSGALGGGLAAVSGIALAGGLFGSVGGIAGMAAAFSNPISAIVVGAALGIGALIGAIGRGKAKREAATAQDQYAAQAREFVKDFRSRQIDYESALNSLTALLADAEQRLPLIGKPGRNAAHYLESIWPDYIRQIDELQKQRDAAAQVLGGMSLPEFSIGGAVPRLNGGILAVLHPGEFVMRRSAVDALGTDFMAALNRAPRFDAGGSVSGRAAPAIGQRVFKQTFQIYQLPGESMRVFVNKVARAVKQATSDGML
jgi:hypothetical protein